MYFEFGENWTCWLYKFRSCQDTGKKLLTISHHVLRRVSSDKFRLWYSISDYQMNIRYWFERTDDNAYINPSSEHETIKLASRLKCAAVTQSRWACNVLIHFPKWYYRSRPSQYSRLNVQGHAYLASDITRSWFIWYTVGILSRIK